MGNTNDLLSFTLHLIRGQVQESNLCLMFTGFDISRLITNSKFYPLFIKVIFQNYFLGGR